MCKKNVQTARRMCKQSPLATFFPKKATSDKSRNFLDEL